MSSFQPDSHGCVKHTGCYALDHAVANSVKTEKYNANIYIDLQCLFFLHMDMSEPVHVTLLSQESVPFLRSSMSFPTCDHSSG